MKTNSKLSITPVRQARVAVSLQSLSPLVVHAWSKKALEMLRLTAAERRKVPKVGRDPEREARESAHYTETGEFGVPAVAIKASIIGAAHKDMGIEKTLARKALFIECNDPGGIIAFAENADPVIREDIVRVGMGATDLRYRYEFRSWRADVSFLIDTELLGVQDLVNLINRAGFSVGLCEHRPEKGGEWGRFRVDETRAIHAEDVQPQTQKAA